MVSAGKIASNRRIPVILDPVGAGATELRTQAAMRIMDECMVTVLRGNASEIYALCGSEVKTRGVDSSLAISGNIIDSASELARKRGMIVAVSGEEDCICDGSNVCRVRNGHPLMSKITGTGCGLSAVTGAFCAVSKDDPLETVAAAFGFYGLCGEIAARIGDKPGSFQVAFLDTLYMAGQQEIDAMLRVALD
jgi:hydroxyethylthiazole kinase